MTYNKTTSTLLGIAIGDAVGALFGNAIGDALGVPVEFRSREYLEQNPIKDYEGFDERGQPHGTFSDDGSMTFCTVESLLIGYNLEDMANRFVRWYKDGYWAAHGICFGSGSTTRNALDRVIRDISPYYAGLSGEKQNGNGSLMRMAPMVFELMNEEDINIRFKKTNEVSSITHAHFRSVFACFIYVEFLSLIHISEPTRPY